MTSNLIQRFQTGFGLASLFQIKEKTPTPTLGSEVVPVVVADTLIDSAFHPRRQVLAGSAVEGATVNNRFHVINCRGSAPDAQSQKLDKLLIKSFDVFYDGGSRQAFIIFGNTSGIAGLGSGFSWYTDTSLDAPAVGMINSDYTSHSQGESADALAITPPLIRLPAGVISHFEGPWVINQGECMGVMITGGGVAFNTWALFRAEEWPGRA